MVQYVDGGQPEKNCKQVLAARVDTEDIEQPASSANSAPSPPPPHSTNPSSIRDDLHSAPLKTFLASPGASSFSAAGSPGRPKSPRDRSGISNPPSSLPVLPKYRGAWDSTTTSSPEDKKAESSVYYTTAWGSPYAAPSPRRLSWSLSQHAGVDCESQVSSPASVRSGIYHGLEPTNPDILIPPTLSDSPTKELSNATLSFSPKRSRLERKGGKSIKDFTQDWINQYLSGQPRTERSNWLSDDSGSEAPSFFTAQNHFTEDGSDDWLGLEQESREEDLLKTPTLADFTDRRGVSSRREGGPGRQRIKEHIHKRADTLRQEDFWGFAYDRDPRPITMTEVKETQPATELEPSKMSPIEKPLPPPPVEASNQLSLAVGSPEKVTESKAVRKEKSDKNSQVPQKQRKKVPWRGKSCFVYLPVDDQRGTKESGYRLLTAEDVNQRLRDWETLGYDIRGFSVCASDDPSNTELGGLSRPQHPDPTDTLVEWNTGSYGVSIPNKALWDEYVNALQEEKLRALGVFLGDDVAPSSPSPASAMNNMAPFPGLVSSPPIPTASATSNPLSIPHHFSPHLNQSTNMSNGMSSMASPASQFSVQTPFMGVDQNILHGYQIPFQPTPPAQGSLTPQSFFNLRQANHASNIPATIPNLTSMMSPVSPLNEQNSFYSGLDDQSGEPKEIFEGQFSHDIHNGFGEDQMLRPHTPENLDNFHASTVEIAQPTPRGHSRGHNLSETLQKGIDQITPDYHLEESIQRQLEEGDVDPTHNNFDGSELLQSRWAVPDNASNSIQHLQQNMHQFYGTSYSGDAHLEGSDIDTNPSLSGTPRRHGSIANHIPWHESKPSSGSYGGGHRSKLSTSTLNVDAKEFDPRSSTFSPAATFQDPSLQFPTLEHSMFTFGSGPDHKPSSGTFNVSAPSFTPGANQSLDFKQDSESREFKFSSASFNVAAAPFNPGTSGFTEGAARSSSVKTKIFDDIDFSKISVPSKKSKAIPIVHPDDTEENINDGDEEADNGNGRPIPMDRNKRARREDEDFDREARFSISNPLSETSNLQTPSMLNTSHAPAEGKENAVPTQDGNIFADMQSVPIEVEKQVERKSTPVSEASTWTPSDTKDSEEISDPAIHNQIRPHTLGLALDDEIQIQPSTTKDGPSPDENKQEGTPEELTDSDLKRSDLSPNTKPFHFKPSVAEFVPVITEKPEPFPKDSPKQTNGLMASRYAVASAPSAPSSPKFDQGQQIRADRPNLEDDTLEGVVHQPDETLGDSIEHLEDSDSPNEEELNAIMEALNGDSDVGVERLSTPRPASNMPESVLGPSKEKRHVHADVRSEPPSPSPGRGPISHALHVPKLDFKAQSEFSATPSKNVTPAIESPIRQLVNRNEHISDWDDMISSGEDLKLENRSRFFDLRINDLVGSAIEERLSPLERSLVAIQQSLMTLNSRPRTKMAWGSVSAEVIDSDADDEDEDQGEDASYRARSPLRSKDRRLERLKNTILEAIGSRDNVTVADQATVSELVQLRETITELQALTFQKMSQDNAENMRDIIKETMTAQLNQRNSRPSEAEEIGADSLMLQVDGLKRMLRVSDERAENDYKKWKEAQDSVAELQRLLRVVEDDAARHSAAAESAEARLLQLQEEKMPYFEGIQVKANILEKERETLRMTLDELSSKNITLQGTLDEYRVSSDNWKRESEQARSELHDVKSENQLLGRTIDSLKTRIEDGLNIRQNLGEKLDRLQDEMATVTRDVTRDQAAWRRREEEHNAKFNELRASHSRETKLREQLEKDINKLEEQEREAAKLKFIFGQSQQENARQEELVVDLRHKNHELGLKAGRFEREFNEARESSRVEIERTRTSLEADLEASNSQVNIVRAELEAQILRLQSQLDNVRLDGDTARERYEMLLEEAHESKANALAAALDSKELAIEEQRKLHERVLNDLRERHARALHNSSEDRQRGESHLMERLALSDDKGKYLEERINHLEEKLEIAQSAARAAAEAAQTAKAANSTSSPPAPLVSPSMSFSKGSSVPEKISPQALRESIFVLQDQLQQRETRIEELETELSAVDKDAPNKLKEKDTEITWLRELLGVRLDDLQDIIHTVSQPSFNHNAVRDAAIRLKANLQMQQQEKERALSGQGFPSLPSLTELTASPRSLPLAAAAAWGNWRKGRENTNSNPSEQTPSKSSNTNSFLSGLLTPPGSNARQANLNGSVPPPSSWRRPSESRSMKSFHTTPRPLSSRAGKMGEPPTTPPLLRRSSYDHDAEPTDYEQNSLGEDESTVDGLVSASPRETGDGPFGPRIA